MATSSNGAEPGRRGLLASASKLLGGSRGDQPGGAGDHMTILSGTAQNIVGLAIFVVASFGMNILIARAFKGQGAAVLGVVTLATQFAFVGGAATRFGMDMASTRLVAIDFGKGETGRLRAVVRLAALVAAIVSVVAAVAVFLASPMLARRFQTTDSVFRAAAIALPFVALTQVFAAASRGLKIMRHTLYAYWIGQSLSWIVFTLIGWQVSKTPAMTVGAYAASWGFGTAVAWFLWHKETGRFEQHPAEAGEVARLVRYGAPRAPAALLSQALFWTDYFVLGLYVHGPEYGVYAASVRLAQMLVLFLTAVSYMFSPFVADLYEKGERQKLDGLFKSITRWTLAATLPLLALLLVVPGPALLVFGAKFVTGTTALRILLIGQIVNVSVGAAGFVLIMVKRTGWDLVVYASSFLIDIAMSFLLIPHLGTTGAAIAQTVTIAVSNALRLYLVWKFVGIHPYNRYYFRLALPFAVCLVAMAGVHHLTGNSAWPVDIAVTGVMGGIAYAATFATLCLTPTERAAVQRVRGRTA